MGTHLRMIPLSEYPGEQTVQSLEGQECLGGIIDRRLVSVLTLVSVSVSTKNTRKGVYHPYFFKRIIMF